MCHFPYKEKCIKYAVVDIVDIKHKYEEECLADKEPKGPFGRGLMQVSPACIISASSISIKNAFLENQLVFWI